MVACLFQLQIHKGSLMKSPEIGIEILSTEPTKYQIMFSISLGWEMCVEENILSVESQLVTLGYA